jgi:mRNA interferase HigB
LNFFESRVGRRLTPCNIAISRLCVSSLSGTSAGKIRADAFKYSDVSEQIERWNYTVEEAEWQNLEEVRQVYRDAEAVGNFTVFNTKDNANRLIVGINYRKQIIYYKYFLTHAEYDKDKWKNDPYF